MNLPSNGNLYICPDKTLDSTASFKIIKYSKTIYLLKKLIEIWERHTGKNFTSSLDDWNGRTDARHKKKVVNLDLGDSGLLNRRKLTHLLHYMGFSSIY